MNKYLFKYRYIVLYTCAYQQALTHWVITAVLFMLIMIFEMIVQIAE